MNKKILAYHFDFTRAMWTRAYIEQMIERLSRWGFTHILCEIESKFRFAQHPSLVHADAWSRQECADFVRSCKAKGMEVIPFVQSLAHVEYVVGKLEYAYLRPAPEVTTEYDPLSEDARSLILYFFDEMIDAFGPTEYFHVGGDEAGLGVGDRAQAVIDEIGIGGLYMQHMTPIFEYVKQRGLRPMIWTDILLTHPEVLNQIPRDVILMDWHYRRIAERGDRVPVWSKGLLSKVEFEALPDSPLKMLAQKYAVDEQTDVDGTFRIFYHVEALHDNKFDFLVASANRCSGDTLAVPATTHMPNVFFSTNFGATLGLGTVITSWACRYNHPELTMPSIFAALAALNDEASCDEESIVRNYSLDAFGTEMPELLEAWRLASKVVPFSESKAIWRAGIQRDEGIDPIAKFVEDGKAEPLIKQEMRTGLPPVARTLAQCNEALEDFHKAHNLIEIAQQKAVQNKHVFDFWLEGIDLMIFYTEFAVAVLADRLPKEAPALLNRLNALRDVTRRLFSETYTPGSIESELNWRYDLQEQYLKQIISNKSLENAEE